MKRFLLITLVILGNFSFANDCQVTGILPNLVMLSCKDRTDQQKFYTVDGKVYEIVKEANGSIFAEGDTTNLKEGDSLTYSMMNQIAKFEEKRVEAKIYLLGVTYTNTESTMESDAIEMKKGSNIDVDFEDEIKGEETNILPSKPILEFNFDKSWGLLVAPDFKNDRGELSVYTKLGAFDAGVFLLHGRDRSSEKLSISGKDLGGAKITSNTHSDKILTSLGILGRYISKGNGHEILSSIKVGYLHSSNEDEDEKFQLTAGYFEIASSLFFNVTKSFLLGFGGSYSKTFNGQFKYETDSFEVVNEAKVTSISFYPLLAQYSF